MRFGTLFFEQGQQSFNQVQSFFITPDHQIFEVYFKVKHVIGCANLDIVVFLCSELFLRLLYYMMELGVCREPTPV